MRFLALFIAFGVFFCYSSIGTTVDNIMSEKQSPLPHCHIVSSNDSVDLNTKTATSENIKSSHDKNSSSCCLLSLLNSKDIASDLQIAQIFKTVNYFIESESSASFKKSKNYLDNGYDPPDIITLKSSFLI